MTPWRTLEHTADLALEAEGPTPGEALAALCRGLLAQITDPETVASRDAVELTAAGLDPPEALVGILGEVLFWVNTRGWLFGEFCVREASERGFRLTARGERRDPDRHPFELEVKAATYHDLFWGPAPEGDGWRARVVFDV